MKRNDFLSTISTGQMVVSSLEEFFVPAVEGVSMLSMVGRLVTNKRSPSDRTLFIKTGIY
jgi:hypothetical protein